ncbi:MAG: hypothetical protein MMC33_006752 [Icmadophila ericetorum]|nr:hypothetical protein [Icmadophila ericetorum]
MPPRDLDETIPRYQIRNSVQEITSPTSARDSFATTRTSSSKGREESSPNESLLTRKRIASQPDRGTWDLNKILSPLPTSGTTYPSPDHLSQVCLCQPDPKVPRPRNAFILFRQHRQVEVVAKNPGLANPEISKIIGEEWRNLLPEVRDRWKGLAEEEKIRHQRDHPDYRYQPRRSTRGNANCPPTGSSSGSAESPRCQKCGGRSMGSSNIMGSHNSMPSTPITPRTGVALQTPSSMNPSGVRMFSQMGSPPRNNDRFRGSRAVSQTHTTSQRHPHPDEEPLSTETKRRRFGNGHYMPVNVQNQQTPYTSNFSRRESLPCSDFMTKSHFAMQAPPRPHQPGYPPQHPLTLPPLKTSSESEATTQAKSVEAMVMSIPILNKIKVLAKISSPLRKPGPASPAFATRGAIIAVDGPDEEAVSAVIQYLSEFLSRDAEFTVRIWDTSATVTLIQPEEMTFATYLQLITHQHEISQEMIRHITTIPSTSTQQQSHSQSRSSPSPISPKTTAPATPTTQRELRNRKSQNQNHNTTTITTNKKNSSPAIPIALIPTYQLSLTDTYASNIPITDSFAPIDHWQWLANVWRGTVGADVTIVVRSDRDGKRRASSSGGDASGPLCSNTEGVKGNGNGNAKAKERSGEVDTSPSQAKNAVPPSSLLHGIESTISGPGKVGVENRLQDARALVLRAFGERELRRVGFEVGEWVRGLSVEFSGRGRDVFVDVGEERKRKRGRTDFGAVGRREESLSVNVNVNVNERVVRENAVGAVGGVDGRRRRGSVGSSGDGVESGERDGRQGRRGSYGERDGRLGGGGIGGELVRKMSAAVGQ